MRQAGAEAECGNPGLCESPDVVATLLVAQAEAGGQDQFASGQPWSRVDEFGGLDEIDQSLLPGPSGPQCQPESWLS